MKKLLLLLLFGTSFAASAQEFNYDGIFYEILDQDAKTCTTKIGTSFAAGNGVSGNITLPANPIYNGEEYTLTEIGDWSFMGSGLESISLPNTITRIGEWAFSLQENLISVNIPESVEIIDNWAFNNCHSLSTVILHNGLKVLGHSVFTYCNSIEELTLPGSLETIKGFLWGHEYELASSYKYNLKKLVCLRPEPPKIVLDEEYPVPWLANGNFMLDATILYVPFGCRDKYLSDSDWGGYGEDRIKEIDTALLFLYRKSLTITKGGTTNLEFEYSYNTSDYRWAPYEITWESSDESVATVEFGRNPNGKAIGIVKAHNAGTARINLKIQPMNLGYEPLTAYCDVTVKEGLASFSLSERNISLELNESKQLTVNITGLEPGNATLKVTLVNSNGEEITESCDITVVNTTTDVTALFTDTENKSVNIYNLNGVLLQSDVAPESVLKMPAGIYIVGNKKVLVR